MAAGLLLGPFSAGPLAAKGADPPPHELLERFCYDCHGHGAAEAELSLDVLVAEGPWDDPHGPWRRVWQRVRDGFMPPPESEQPNAEERRAIVRWVERAALGVDPQRTDPGRVTIRRLNREEYQWTLLDLVGLDITRRRKLPDGSELPAIADLLPADGSAFGFRNNGDAQPLSPDLMVRYVELAEEVVGAALVLTPPDRPTVHFGDDAWRRAEPASGRQERRTLRFTASDGPHDVRLRFELGGWNEHRGAYDLELLLDDRPLASGHFEVGGERAYEYGGAADLAAGDHTLTLAVTPTGPGADGELHPLWPRPDAWLVASGGSGPPPPETHARVFIEGAPPVDQEARRAYAERIVRRFADRAFRRPTDPESIDRLVQMVLEGETFEQGVGRALTAVLASPRFLYRAEPQPRPDDPAEVHPLDDHALASRLSYWLWLSLPDDELRSLADRGALRDQLPEQVARMLADPKADRFLNDFSGQWLRSRDVLSTPISKDDGPLNEVRWEMLQEAERFFSHVVREERDLLELVTADYTFLNPRLARFYGVPGVEGDHWRRVDLPADSPRGGVLGQGALLVATSNPNRTSPVKRGVFVLENLLATPPPPPPAAVPALREFGRREKRTETVRSQLEAHRADPACASCHAHFDPFGLALENFDHIGRYRTEDDGLPVDATAETTTGVRLAGVQDFKRWFADNPRLLYRGAAERLLGYALGRGLEPSDAQLVDDLVEGVAASGGRFSALTLAIAQSPAFCSRRGDGGVRRPTPPDDAKLSLSKPAPSTQERPR